ncbi:MAG: NAD(P)/FAD-dependent oxidoreductase [Flammeovirgaceae bacterium]
MENDKTSYPVIIVGGGPAGLATSLTLHFRGINHCMVEALAHPVAKPGEAIPPNARPLLKQLGIESLLQTAPHRVYHGNKSCWGTDLLLDKDHLFEPHEHGYLLNRTAFEGDLQQVVKDQYTPFFNGYRVKTVEQKQDGYHMTIDNGQEKQLIVGEFLVDATGRKASICRQLGIRKVALDEQFALIVQLETAEYLSHQIWIEATENGWWYLAPLAGKKLSLMFFTLKALLPQRNVATFLEHAWRQTKHLAALIQEIDFNAYSIGIRPAGTSYLPQPFGQNWLAVGDAAYAYDPISSFGITSALAGGFYAGHALADWLAGKQEALSVYRYVVENAFRAYLQKLEKHYDLEQRWSNSPYWSQRLVHQRNLV